MITTLKSLLQHAENHNSAVLAPDFHSLFVMRAFLEQAEEMRAPLILSYVVGFKPIMEMRQYKDYINIIRKEIEQLSIPVCLHLDHAENLRDIQEAIDVGFTSVMIDASTKPFQQNIALTQKTVELARPHQVSVEAELGTILSSEDYVHQTETTAFFTNPYQAADFVEQTKIDALAVSIGNVHGAYRGEPNIDFERLAELNRVVPVPLVMHGTSGIGSDNLKQAISLGIRKINLYTDIIREMHTRMQIALSGSLTDTLSIVKAQQAGAQHVLAEYIQLAGDFHLDEFQE